MKAFVVDKYGQDGLRAAEVPEPVAGPRDVLVRVSAASINPLDTLIRNGEFKRLIKHQPPFVLGHDLAGVVIAVGPDVHGVRRRRRGLRPSPRLPHRHLRRSHRHRRGRRRAQAGIADALRGRRGPAGGPGRRADPRRPRTPAARSEGARPRRGRRPRLDSDPARQAPRCHSATTTSAPPTRTWSAASGPTSSSTTPRRTSPRCCPGYDLVIDSLGADNLQKSLTVLKPGGLAIGVAGPPDAGFARQLGAPSILGVVMSLLSRKVRATARALGVRYEFFFMQASGTQLRELGALYDAVRCGRSSTRHSRSSRRRGDGPRRAGAHQGRQGRRLAACCPKQSQSRDR